MHKTQELTNMEKPIECCTLETGTGQLAFYKGDKKTPGFTGEYSHDIRTGIRMTSGQRIA